MKSKYLLRILGACFASTFLTHQAFAIEPKVDPKTVGTWEFQAPDSNNSEIRQMTAEADGTLIIRSVKIDGPGDQTLRPENRGTFETADGHWVNKPQPGKHGEDMDYEFLDPDTIKLSMQGHELLTMKRVSADAIGKAPAAKVDPKTIGTWEFEEPRTEHPATRQMITAADGTFRLHTVKLPEPGQFPPDEQGNFETANGHWVNKESRGKHREDMNYEFLDPDTIKLSVEGQELVKMKRISASPEGSTK